MNPHAQLIKHTATLFWLDKDGHQQKERHAAWSPSQATAMAWRRARSMRLSGDALAFRIAHHQKEICA